MLLCTTCSVGNIPGNSPVLILVDLANLSHNIIQYYTKDTRLQSSKHYWSESSIEPYHNVLLHVYEYTSWYAHVQHTCYTMHTCTVYLIHVCTCTTKCTAHEYNVHVSTYSTTQQGSV